MNTRILNLIKNPEIIQNQDLDLLKLEIKKYPYLQNFRALHLFGTHKFDAENYQKELSVTAAFTTDKKILYQLINKKKEIVSFEETHKKEDNETAAKSEIEAAKNIFTEITPIPLPIAKPILIDGVLNRILFEGEEDFMDRDTEKIDFESTQESGKLVTASIFKEEITIPEKIESSEKSKFSESKDAESFSTEKIINEANIQQEEPEIKSAKVSFHGIEEFLPNISIKSNISEEKHYEVPKPVLSKGEIEMQKLIAKVEAKMKMSKKEKVPEEEPAPNKDLNFSETQSFEISSGNDLEIREETISNEKDIIKTLEEFSPKLEENISKSIKISDETAKIENPIWKPMSFSGNNPDSLMEKKEEEKPVSETNSKEKIELNSYSNHSTVKSEERPEFNLSFFSDKVSSCESEKTENISEKTQESNEKDIKHQDSNIPNFINTWQNWLKIERQESKILEKTPISKIEVKKAVIENFIEKEPKISKLKEESDFVVKEKGTNISHLMTETLAKLYAEQKLYAKAIKAYETLILKHPQKKQFFEGKIQEIKELKKNS